MLNINNMRKQARREILAFGSSLVYLKSIFKIYSYTIDSILGDWLSCRHSTSSSSLAAHQKSAAVNRQPYSNARNGAAYAFRSKPKRQRSQIQLSEKWLGSACRMARK